MMGWMWRKRKKGSQGTSVGTLTEMGKMSRAWKMIENFILDLFEIAYETYKW